MLKEIFTTTVIATGIYATPITQKTNKSIYMDNQSYWTEQRIPTNGVPTGIKAYRNTQTTNPVINSTLNIKQRSLETYEADRGQLPLAESTYYLLVQIETETNIVLDRATIQIYGQIVNTYEFSSCTLEYGWDENNEITDANIENYLNGATYNTIEDYTTLRQHLDTIDYNNQTVSLNSQNYTDVLNDLTLSYNLTTSGTPLIFFCKIDFFYQSNEIPNNTPYSPFNNYGKQVIYKNITFTADVPSSPTGEIVDIPGIMFTMLGMPFAFVAQAFDLTIFPGTAYAINLSHIFLAIAGAAILLFVIKKVMK